MVSWLTQIYLEVGLGVGVHEACEDLAHAGHDAYESVVYLQEMAEDTHGQQSAWKQNNGGLFTTSIEQRLNLSIIKDYSFTVY